VDEQIKKLDANLAQLDAKYEDKATGSTINMGEGSQKSKCLAIFNITKVLSHFFVCLFF